MTVPPSIRRAWLLLMAVLAGNVGSLESQSRSARPSVTVFSGVSTGGPGSDGLLVGLEFRTPELGRLSAAAAGSTWQFVRIVCGVIPGGPPCADKKVKAFDIGPVVRLTPPGRSWRLEATARIGGLWDHSGDPLWNPSVGFGFGFGQLRRVGGLLGLRYHPLSRSSTHPETGDLLAASAGLQLRF